MLVHKLRPGDIKVVAALGDSITVRLKTRKWLLARQLWPCSLPFCRTSWESIKNQRRINSVLLYYSDLSPPADWLRCKSNESAAASEGVQRGVMEVGCCTLTVYSAYYCFHIFWLFMRFFLILCKHRRRRNSRDCHYITQWVPPLVFWTCSMLQRHWMAILDHNISSIILSPFPLRISPFFRLFTLRYPQEV